MKNKDTSRIGMIHYYVDAIFSDDGKIDNQSFQYMIDDINLLFKTNYVLLNKKNRRTKKPKAHNSNVIRFKQKAKGGKNEK